MKKPISKPKKDFWYSKINKPTEIAIYFGFKPDKELIITNKNQKLAEEIIKKEKKIKKEEGIRKTEDLVEFMKEYLEQKQNIEKQEPILSVFYKKTSGHHKNKKLFLEILGESKNLADTLILVTTLNILKEAYKTTKFKILINSVGDKDSFNRFYKEFVNYYKKYLNDLSVTCKNNWSINPFLILDCPHGHCQNTAEEAPKPFSFLSESSRWHFKEILEDLENMDIEYEIDEKMVSGKPFICHTLFKIKNQKDELLAEGGRYDILSKKMGRRKKNPAVGVTIEIPKNKIKNNKNVPFPKIFFIQIGQKAKIKSLKIIDELKKINIPMMQSLSKDKISSQLNMAEKYKIPFAIIMGQQECIENTVILRNLFNRKQHTIPINKLKTELKKYLE